jgi:hypothetical protein
MHTVTMIESTIITVRIQYARYGKYRFTKKSVNVVITKKVYTRIEPNLEIKLVRHCYINVSSLIAIG